MSFKIGGPERGADPGAAAIVEHASHGGLLATILSAVALLISGLSYYETTLKTAELSVYVPPMIHYARDGRDVFNVPVTIANDGARTGTVLTMELEVERISEGEGMKKRRFHAAFIGEYPRGEDKTPSRSFAPLAIAGHSTFTETVRFYPMDDDDGVLVSDKGDFRFTLTLLTAKPDQPGMLEQAFRTDPAPLVFELNLPYLAIQHIAFRNGTQAMFNKNWRPAASTSTDPAIKRAAPEREEAPAPQAEPTPPPDNPAPAPEAEPAPETGGEAAPPARKK